MKLRLSESKDRAGLIALWNEAFGDSVDSIEFFLNNRYIPENTVVAEENGIIISMLYLLEGKVSSDKIYSAYYLYAAATLKSHRGRGIMADMLTFAEDLAFKRNVDLICLKPADDRLYEFYSKFGYKTVFATKTVIINSDGVYKNSNNVVENCNNYFAARENAFKNYGRFVWDNKAIKFAIDYHKYYSGKVLERRNGFSLYSCNDSVCSVKELCFTTDLIDEILKELSSVNVSKTQIDLPVDYPINCDHYVIKPNGMALAVSQYAKDIFNLNNLYLNLTLD